MRCHQFAVVIGRYQPFHNGHLRLLRTALSIADHVIVVVGSASPRRTKKNPFTFLERASMIEGALKPSEVARVHITPMTDVVGNDKRWAAILRRVVHSIAWQYATERPLDLEKNGEFILVGHHKDASSFYLQLFDEYGWRWHDPGSHGVMSATDIRKLYFGDKEGINCPAENWCKIICLVPDSTRRFLNSFQYTGKPFERLCK